MRTSFGVAAILAVLSFAASGAWGQQMASFQCIATSVTPGASHISIYVSQLIPMEMSQRVALSGAWGTYIKTTYHLENTSSAVCQPFSMNPTYQEQALAAEETAWKRQGWDVVHVVWKPGQSASLKFRFGDIDVWHRAKSRRGSSRDHSPQHCGAYADRARAARLVLLFRHEQADHLFQRSLRHRGPAVRHALARRFQQNARAEVRV